jgi:NAD(P)-dependent dehydrogenase (short-subunit alcohol dehydrogenase family)
MGKLKGHVALVAGATRGAGRGIARMLGEAGATVYCTGRSTRADARPTTASADAPFDLSRRPETIEETAELVTAAGGQGIAVKVDHTDDAQVAALVARIRDEQARLDLLVNDVWGGESLAEWGPFWELDPAKGLLMVETVLRTHVLTTHHATPLMLGSGGLIVEITDGDFLGYRGTWFYDLAKIVPIRLAYGMAADLELRAQTAGAETRGKLTALALTPGFLRSEAMLDFFGVTEANWRDGIAKDRHFAESETPCYVGRAVAALAADSRVHEKAGRAFASGPLAKEYGFTDIDGRQPDFPTYFARFVDDIVTRGSAPTDEERALVMVHYQHLHLEPAHAATTQRLATFLGLR